MTFSFTHSGIGNILLLKHEDGVTISGVMEARGMGKTSQFARLNYSEIDVSKDGNKGNMHHKVFIIDEKTVITGSFNPTNNGNTGNDENLVIIENENVAARFMKEFEYVYERRKID